MNNNTLPDELGEGDFLYSNWGYNQTNHKFAKTSIAETRSGMGH